MTEMSNYLDIEESGVFDTYIDLHNKYNEKYGKACILFQCGSFFEIYGWEDETVKLGDIYTICEAAGNIAVVPKGNKCLMAGFNPAMIDKYAPLLVESGYTVVIVEQVTPPPKPKRSITRIISPSTYLDDINLGNSNKIKNKVLMSVFVEFNKTGDILAISMAAMDLSLGKSTLYTVYANDKEKCVDECFRFIHSMEPIEIMFYTEREEQLGLLKKHISDFGIENIVSSIHTKIVPSDYQRSQYIQEFLKKFYPDTGMLSPLEYLGLALLQSLATTFVILVNFAYEHDETITKQLHKPIFWENKKYLTIENNGIYQLNVVKTHNINKSLIDILDYTSTNIGRRLHKYRLLNPIIDTNVLNKRYSQIEWMIEGDKYKGFEEALRKVLDIERLHRKIENGTITPQNFSLLERSYEEILKVMDIFNNYYTYDLEHLFSFWNVQMYENFITWRDDYRNIFNIKECQKYNLTNIRGSFFNRGIDPTIDLLQEQLENKKKEISNVANVLSDSIKDYVTVFSKGKKKKQSTDDDDDSADFIKIEHNDRDGFYYSTTKKRAELVKKYGETEIKKLGWNELRYSNQTSTVKITSDNLNHINKSIDILESSLQTKCLELFLTKVQELYKEHKYIFDDIVQFISEIDWICSSAKCAIVNFYCKPQIIEDSTSYITAKAMRHPIIEKILSSSHYVPNDIQIGTADQKGMLLFGTNSSGKSSLMKSVGLNVIMAQCGMYVPCKEFTYNPYKNILTRITGDDNFSKGFSSFVVEMTELRTILNRSCSNSLILGDEICHGTEQVSALAIVSSSIVELSKKNCNFIFATHLHRLSNMEEITELHNVQCWHLKVLYDEPNDCLVYDRKLEKGAGSDLYGLEVAKYIIQDQPDFIKRCMTIRRKILDIPVELVSSRTSKYNAKLVVDKCKICGNRADDTHHIDFQCSANSDGAIQRGENRFHKNVEANLVALCKTCHVKVHHSVDGKKYNIEGYIQTSKGTILKWTEMDC
jgi:DNA mismatch repair protein MutS